MAPPISATTASPVASEVLATGYAHVGALVIAGADAFGTQVQATLDIDADAPAVLTGSVSLYGDALLEFAGNINAAVPRETSADLGFTSIGYNASLLLDGSGARISIGPSASNSAWSDLSLNNGLLNLEGDWGNGVPGGVDVETGTGYLNLGVTYVDGYGGAADSELEIGGAPTNSGLVNGTTAAS